MDARLMECAMQRTMGQRQFEGKALYDESSRSLASGEGRGVGRGGSLAARIALGVLGMVLLVTGLVGLMAAVGISFRWSATLPLLISAAGEVFIVASLIPGVERGC